MFNRFSGNNASPPFEFRILSPPIPKKTPDPVELERKQLKAQELRETYINDKIEKQRSKKVQVETLL